MSYRGKYDYTPLYYSTLPPRTIRRDYVTTTTERRFGGPVTEYVYETTTTKRSTTPTYYYEYPEYRSTVTTTRMGPYGIRTYRY